MLDYDLLVRDCRMLMPDLSVQSGQTICIQGGRIAAIVSGAAAQECRGRATLEGRGKLAMPGLVDGHTHAAQQLLRGSVTDEMPMIWARILVPFESSLTPQDAYAGARL